MEVGAGIENETLQSLIRDCLLELNRLKFDLTELEVAKSRDTTPQKIQELENHVLNKEKEVSLIKFKAEDEIGLLKKELEEKDALIKNQEDRIYELDYVNNSLDEIKEYFAEQLRDYKKKELAEVNERLNDSFKSIAEKDAQINSLSRTIDDYKIQVIKLENNSEFESKISALERELEYKINELSEKNDVISSKENEISLLKESTIPKDSYINLQKELSSLKESTIPKDNYIHLQNELSSLKESTVSKSEYDNVQKELTLLKESSVSRSVYINVQKELSFLKESTVPKFDYDNVQNELSILKNSTVPKENYINLQRELSSRDDKIKRLEEINAFFTELQEEQEAYDTVENTPPFKLEKKRFKR